MENNHFKNEVGLNKTYRNFFSVAFKQLAGAINGIMISSIISTICILIRFLPSYYDYIARREGRGLDTFLTIISIISTIYSLIKVWNIYHILKTASETLDDE